ncbi:hypothetical protein [Paraburkholderia xenovorans]
MSNATELVIDHANAESPNAVDIRALERRTFSRAVIRNSALRTDQEQFMAEVTNLRNRGFDVVVQS